MRIDIQRISSGEDEVILRYKEENKRIRAILDAIRGSGDKLYGKVDGEKISINPSDILYVESVDDKIFAYTKKEVVRLDGTLAGLLETFNDVKFFRCSKSMIINIEKVDRLKAMSSNRIDATMEGGEHIMISRTYASEFRRILKGVTE